MLQHFSWYWTKVFQITDVTLLVTVWFLTEIWLSRGSQIGVLERLSGNTSAAAILIGCWAFVALLFARYQSKRLVSLIKEVKILTLVIIIYFFLLNVFVSFELLSHPNIMLFAVTTWISIVGFHMLRVGLRTIRAQGLNHRQVVIYGAGTAGQRTARHLVMRPQLGMHMLGFLDDDPALQGNMVRSRGVELPVLGTSWDLARLAVIESIDEVIIPLPSQAHHRLKEFIVSIGDLPVNVRVVPNLFDVISVKAHSDGDWDIPVVGVRQPCIDGTDALVKRAIDIFASVMGLVMVTPLMLTIAVAIKLDSRGPILFRQERSGLNGKTFTMYKFRTMVVDAEAQLAELVDVDALDQPAFKIVDDPRVTKVGRFLRKTSLDELPQFFNVLLGHMSLVGPRPEEAKIVRLYSYEQRQRLAVKPGITGPMQVNGRGDLGFDERLSLEVNYIKNYSLYQDLVLLLRTVPAVLLGKGAR